MISSPAEAKQLKSTTQSAVLSSHTHCVILFFPGSMIVFLASCETSRCSFMNIRYLFFGVLPWALFLVFHTSHTLQRCLRVWLFRILLNIWLMFLLSFRTPTREQHQRWTLSIYRQFDFLMNVNNPLQLYRRGFNVDISYMWAALWFTSGNGQL